MFRRARACMHAFVRVSGMQKRLYVNKYICISIHAYMHACVHAYMTTARMENEGDCKQAVDNNVDNEIDD